MVAADPYEMRLVCPKGLKATAINVSDTTAAVSIIEQPGKLARVTITPSITGSMHWSMTFE